MIETAPRIGIFGGTFDPPHLGHLLVASHARALLDLDRVLLVVANDPWQKSDRQIAPADARLAMVDQLVAGAHGLESSAIEIERGGATYSADTVDQLRSVHPTADFVLILGRDAAMSLPTWNRADDLAGAVTVAVADRPGSDVDDLPSGWDFIRLEIPMWEISSSDIRARLAASAPVDVMMPPAVVAVIAAHKLYGVGDD